MELRLSLEQKILGSNPSGATMIKNRIFAGTLMVSDEAVNFAYTGNCYGGSNPPLRANL